MHILSFTNRKSIFKAVRFINDMILLALMHFISALWQHGFVSPIKHGLSTRNLQLHFNFFSHSGAAELIEKHSNYLCNTLSLNIRQLHRYPTSALVLCSVLQYSHATILPYIEQIITEVSEI